ncbi:transmembrane channel-like protein 5 [Latimeria chalumnae]|uniref:transmembrane channel-like protein 5 n=1 Tax=Latimeria chalumnae TaxID=7897 RepID=UPI00313E2A8C
MSTHFGEGLQNLAYHYSETLEMDRGLHGRISTRGNSSFHQNPYDPYGNPYGPEQREREDPEMIPMTPGWSEHEQRRARPPIAYINPYGDENGHANPSFEMDPEDMYRAPLSSYNPNGPTGAVLSPYMEAATDPSMGGGFTARRRRKSSFSVTMLSTRSNDLKNIASSLYEDEKKEDELHLIGTLADMPADERTKALRQLVMNLQEKREFRQKVYLAKEHKSALKFNVNYYTTYFQTFVMSLRRYKESLFEFFHSLSLWNKTLKDISGKFGTSVVSYFLFLRWLLLSNVFAAFILFGFITIPQFFDMGPNNASFSGLEILTGTGFFTNTVLYYGFYTNGSVEHAVGVPVYNMQLAYIFTLGIYFVICFFIMLYSMGTSFRNNFITANAYSERISKFLCSWDFNITNEKTIKLKQKILSTQLKELLSEKVHRKQSLTLYQKIKHMLIHVAAWLVSMGSAAACCAGVYYLCDLDLKMFKKSVDLNNLSYEASQLLLPTVVSLINLLLPLFYSFLNVVEKYKHPRRQIYALILRNVFLKMSIIAVLSYYWLQKVALSDIKCWETYVGQELYRLVVTNFVFSLLSTFCGEFLLNIIGTTCIKQLGTPEFDIARNVLELIYGQTLVWIGLYFAPLLPIIQIIKYLVIFYVKKVSLMMNCQPSRRAWRAAQMTTVFISLMFFPSFSGAVIILGVTLWKREPSRQCGPFQGLPLVYDAVTIWIHEISSTYRSLGWLVFIYNNFIHSTLFFFILTILALSLVYLHWQIIDGRKIKEDHLRKRITNEAKDKALLLKKLRYHQERQPKVSINPKANQSDKEEKASLGSNHEAVEA